MGGGLHFPYPSRTSPGVHPASYTVRTGSFPGVKRPMSGVDHAPPSTAKRKSTPLWTLVACFRANFTFTFPPKRSFYVPSKVAQMHAGTHRSAVRGVPRVVARRPWQDIGERSNEVSQSPRDDHVVVEVNVKSDQHHGVPDTWR